MIAVGGLCLTLIAGIFEWDRPVNSAPWWQAGHVGLVVLLAVVAIAPRRANPAHLRRLWVLIPLLGAALQASTFLGGGGIVRGELWDPTWTLSGVYLALLVLLHDPGKGEFARIYVLAFAFSWLPLVAYVWAFGEISPLLFGIAAVQFTNVGYSVFLILFRRRMRAYFRIQVQWEQRELAAAMARAELTTQRNLARLVHDRVLSVLNAAALWRGPTTGEIVGGAHEALSLFDFNSEHTTRAEQSTMSLQTELLVMAEAIDPRCGTRIQAESGKVPSECSTALFEACSEALRNSVRHAQRASRTLVASLAPLEMTVVIKEDGAGFDPTTIAADRLGLKESIFGRMRDINGGAAVVRSEIGMGTTVTLTWQRPL